MMRPRTTHPVASRISPLERNVLNPSSSMPGGHPLLVWVVPSMITALVTAGNPFVRCMVARLPGGVVLISKRIVSSPGNALAAVIAQRSVPTLLESLVLVTEKVAAGACIHPSTRQRQISAFVFHVFIPPYSLSWLLRCGIPVFSMADRECRRGDDFRAVAGKMLDPMLAGWIFLAGFRPFPRTSKHSCARCVILLSGDFPEVSWG